MRLHPDNRRTRRRTDGAGVSYRIARLVDNTRRAQTAARLSGCSRVGCTEICDNGQDDDADGYTDCNDANCAGFVGCGPSCTCGSTLCIRVGCAEICDNGQDDDADGHTDCDDTDCAGTSTCSTGTKWTCNPAYQNDTTCDCGCGEFDSMGCELNDPAYCDVCADTGSCASNVGCSAINLTNIAVCK
jgi:hypothetical protein